MQEIEYQDGKIEKKIVDLLGIEVALQEILKNPKVKWVKYYRIPSRKKGRQDMRQSLLRDLEEMEEGE